MEVAQNPFVILSYFVSTPAVGYTRVNGCLLNAEHTTVIPQGMYSYLAASTTLYSDADGTLRYDSLLQSWKMLSMYSTFGALTVSRFVHPENVPLYPRLSANGNVTEVNPVQP